jgi:hypothetical protein
MWNLWWTKFQLDRVFSEYIGVPLSLIISPILHARSLMNHSRYVIAVVDSDVESHIFVRSILIV